MEETIQYLQIATNIVIILLFIGLVILTFILINQAKKVSEKIEGLSSTINDIKPKVLEVVEKAGSLTDNVNKIALKVSDNISVLGTAVDKIKDTVDSVVSFEKKIQEKIEPPVMDTVNTIAAINIGVKTFFDSWKSKKKNRIREIEDERLELIEGSLDEVNKELDEVNARLSDLQK